jgi:hypothetical protein
MVNTTEGPMTIIEDETTDQDQELKALQAQLALFMGSVRPDEFGKYYPNRANKRKIFGKPRT